MLEDYLVRYCAPTLAGIKTASLFSYPCRSKDQVFLAIRRINIRLRAKGVRIIPLRYTDKKVLIYLYRPAKLREDLYHPFARQLLESYGYNMDSCELCLSSLIRKMHHSAIFPHEIGLFLGYPPEDVLGFIQNAADNCKFSGTWKVYSNTEHALAVFNQFKKCNRIYAYLWCSGVEIEELTMTC